MIRRSFLTLAILAAPAFGQATGLNALSDEKLYDELARRGQEALLDRVFEQNNVPATERDAIRAGAALERLARDAQSMRPEDRRAEVTRVVTGIRPALTRIDDPARLARQAEALLNAGVLLDVNTLEYWGPNLTTQAGLRPAVETVLAMLDRAADLAAAQAADLAERTNPNDLAPMRKLEALETLTQTTLQHRALADYYLALCLEPGDPVRAQSIDRALELLASYDNEGNPARGNLKLVLGKLHALRGDFDAARANLDFVSNLPPVDGTDIAAQQQRQTLIFQGRYFRAVVEVQARDAVAARAKLDELIAWQQSVRLADPSVQTANELLEYRIVSLAGDAASRERGHALLTKLLAERPELEPLILAQLRTSIDRDADVSRLEPLLLRALMIDAQEQVARRERDAAFAPDASIVSRGLDAARELSSRTNVEARLAANARFLVGAFLETLDRRAEAAAAFAEFVERERSPEFVDLARAALSNAQRLFAQLGGLDSEEAGVAALYDRIVPLSIAPPFSQKELNYDWAIRLQQLGRADEAIPFFRAVERDDRRYAAARYYLMVALSQQLDALAGDAKTSVAAEIQRLADEVRADVQRSLAGADEATRAVLRQRGARTTILAADVARADQNDAARALSLLADIEAELEGVPDAGDLLGEAMFTRVQAWMQQGNVDNAVRELVKLLDRTGGAQGAQIVFNMLERLEQDFIAAEAAGDRPRMARVQAGRAALTPYLVRWAESSDDPAVRASAYRYRVYAAETQRVAATFAEGDDQRRAMRDVARQQFEALDSDEGRQQYAATRGEGRSLGYDPQVMLGLARLKFDAEDWSGTRDGYARLLADRAVGTAITTVTEAGQERQVDNDAYWETTLRFIRATLNAGGDVAPLRTLLKEQDIRWGDRAGGTAWRTEFESLKTALNNATTAPAR